MSHWLGRLTALLATVFLLTGMAAVGLPGAAAASPGGGRGAGSPSVGSPSAGSPIAGSASGPAAHLAVRTEPFGDYVDRLSFDVSAVNPALVTADGSNTYTVTGTLKNNGPEAISDLIYRFHRGGQLGDTAAVRQELAEPSEPTEVVQESFTDVAPAGTTLDSGASIPFRFTASITGAQGLSVTAPGVYPLMVNVNGGVVLPDGPLAARVGELHLLLTVMGVPGTAPAGGNPGQVTPGRSQPLPVNIVWPVVDQPHLGVGGVFLNEDLLAAIAPGGRLTTLVNALTDPAAAAVPLGSVTVVLDPQLLDELDRMSQPYRVVSDPAKPQPTMNEIVQAAQSAAETAATAASTPPASTPPASTPPASTPLQRQPLQRQPLQRRLQAHHRPLSPRPPAPRSRRPRPVQRRSASSPHRHCVRPPPQPRRSPLPRPTLRRPPLPDRPPELSRRGPPQSVLRHRRLHRPTRARRRPRPRAVSTSRDRLTSPAPEPEPARPLRRRSSSNCGRSSAGTRS